MTFTMDDVDDVLQILQLVKDTNDIELHMDVGDMKLSVWKGNVGDRTTGASDFSRGTTSYPPLQPEQKAAPPAAPAVPKEEPAPAAAPTMPEKAEEDIPEGLVPIKATVTSVFYRKPSPEEPPFVEVGSEVNEDSVVCLLEVMKCFRSVNAGVKGRVEKILAESGQLVEYGTVLILIRPT
jgi:acetyl-CoA carboxylase biotin carboxyl carrier protein